MAPAATNAADRVRTRAYRLRTDLLALAGRASKPALDALLAGYYTEAFALVRTMIDAFMRVTFVRLKPEEHRRWYAPDDPADEPPSDDINTGLVDGAVRSGGTDEDRSVFREANLCFKLLSAGAHPSGEAITQMLDPSSGRGLFGPLYIPHLCAHGFTHGVFAHVVLLREAAGLGHQSPDWLAALDHLTDVSESHREAMAEALGEVERAEAVRRARRAAQERSPCRT